MRGNEGQVRILLIDDNCGGLAARKFILRNLGYEVVTATSGEKGLELFRSSAGSAPFSLAVTDYRMPGGMYGDEVIAKLRSVAPEVPLVLLTGLANQLSLTPESTGADLVLEKGPHEQFDLVEAVLRLAPVDQGQRRKPPTLERDTLAGVPTAKPKTRTG